jgi:single-stranded-DNA-specific exonuclease
LTPEILQPELSYDVEIGLEELNLNFYSWLQRCAPFGVGNPEPVILTRELMVRAPIRVIKEKHVCLQLGDKAGIDPESVPALGWSRAAVDWQQECERLGLDVGSVVDILYRVRRNTGQYAGPHFDGIELDLLGIRLAKSCDRTLC